MLERTSAPSREPDALDRSLLERRRASWAAPPASSLRLVLELQPVRDGTQHEEDRGERAACLLPLDLGHGLNLRLTSVVIRACGEAPRSRFRPRRSAAGMQRITVEQEDHVALLLRISSTLPGASSLARIEIRLSSSMTQESGVQEEVEVAAEARVVVGREVGRAEDDEARVARAPSSPSACRSTATAALSGPGLVLAFVRT